MEKKTYQNPEMGVVKLDNKQLFLMSSTCPDDIGGGCVEGGGGGTCAFD
jgi:hypothetical protein